MDVDLLRPGTVPISPDTILWFEFLLNPSLLQKHLSKSFPGKQLYNANRMESKYLEIMLLLEIMLELYYF